MSHPSLANSQNVAAEPSAAPPAPFQAIFRVVDVHNATPEAIRVIRAIGVPVPENIGWVSRFPPSASSSPPADCSSPSSASSDGQLEPTSGPSRRTKQSKTTRRKAAGPRTRSNPLSGVARPENCFFLFRKAFIKSKGGEAYLKSLEGKQNNISRIAGHLWRKMSDKEKEPYRRKQQELAHEHKLHNPDYQFTPERRGPIKKRVNKKKELEDALAEYLVSLHGQNLSTVAIEEAAERFKEEFKAKRASASPASSPTHSTTESPSAFVDPLYPPGDRTPQSCPAQPVVIELTPAPASAPSSTLISTPSSSSASSAAQSASSYPMEPLALPSQRYPYNAMSALNASAPASWSTQASAPSYIGASAYTSAPAQHFAAPPTYQQDASFAYQDFSFAQDHVNLSLNFSPVDAFPLEQTAFTDHLGQQRQIFPDLPPSLFDSMMAPAFEQPSAVGLQDPTFSAQPPYQPQFQQQQLPVHPYYALGPSEQQWAVPAPAMDIPDLAIYSEFDPAALQLNLTREQQAFFAQNGQHLYNSHSQGAQVQWNA